MGYWDNQDSYAKYIKYLSSKIPYKGDVNSNETPLKLFHPVGTDALQHKKHLK